MMERIPLASAKGQAWLKAYNASCLTSLSQIYPEGVTPKKREMWDYAITVMNALGGYDMRVTGFTDHSYSCACIGWVDGKKSLLFFSARKDHYVPLED